MSRLFLRVGYVATPIGLVLAAEMYSPGITIVASFVVAKVATGLVQAAMYPLSVAAIFWLGWKASEHVTRRDTLQEVAEATAKARLREAVPSTRQRPSSN